ncbi:MAG: ribosome biogenesis GTPase Der [Eubacteriales bacterium]|jgi:GTP-binding protein|nr:ribosome biogenesis GTPase Der [Eubacteriales bacterium]
MSKPTIAIVGRPNVGKSTIFNKIVGRRISIVEDTPGVTRDRIYAQAEWNGRAFNLVDTGGIEPASKDRILSQMREQAQLAIDTAHVIILVVDVKEGLTANDAEVATMLLKSGKPVVLACNKSDTPGSAPLQMYDFYNLGIGDPIAVSGIHGMGIGDLLDEVFKYLPEDISEDEDDDVIKVTIVGKPNVGKSSLINRILGEERVIVTPIAGTTRDAIDTYYTHGEDKYLFIDTAGMRRRGKITDSIERYSVVRSLSAVDRAEVALIMIDAEEGVTEQDTKIAGYAHESGKACIIVVNKWDLIEKETNTMNNYRKQVQEKLPFMLYAPVMFISAKTGLRVHRLFEMIKFVYDQNAMRISTGMLNDVLNDATAKVQPPSDKGKRLKIYYMTQVSTRPPTFVAFVNDEKLAHFSYMRYLENQLRETFGFEGTPIRIITRERND